MKRAKWEAVGHISVDGGSIQIGDPCYDVDQELVDKALNEYDAAVIPHDGDTEELKRGFGAAAVLHTGLGDGIYTIEVKRDPDFHDRIKEMRIKFF